MGSMNVGRISIFYCDYFMVGAMSIKTCSGSRLLDHKAFENFTVACWRTNMVGPGSLSQKYE